MRGIASQPRPWRRFVALGDSFSEGLMDVVGADGRHVGWADRTAAALAPRVDDFRYANLAIRGRTMPPVVAEQVPVALAMSPDLVSLAAGVNDTLRRSFDLHVAATAVENGVKVLRAAGIDVLLWNFGDPSRKTRLMNVVARRIDAYNRATRAIAEHYGCYLVDLWGVAILDDERFWDADRLHLSPPGHDIASAAALQALGLGDDSWRTPPAITSRPPVHARAKDNVVWAKDHLSPWIMRRVRGQSSGDAITPKYPDWVPAPVIPGWTRIGE